MSPEPSFDFARLDWTAYNNLSSASDKANFMQTVEAYLDYLRGDPASSADYDDDAQNIAAQAFLRMVNNDVGWHLARTVVPEFQTPM